MKRKLLILPLLGLAFLTSAAWAGVDPKMDPLAVAPDMYKLVFENDRVRVMEVDFQPGQKIAKHSHPDHFVYVLTDGKLRLYKTDGSSSDVDLKVGQVVWIPAETHWAENIGTTVVRLSVNELKEPAPSKSKKKG